MRYYPALHPTAYASDWLSERLELLLADRQAHPRAAPRRWQETLLLAEELTRRGLWPATCLRLLRLVPELRPAHRLARPTVDYPTPTYHSTTP